MDDSAFIMHHVHGSTTEINPEATRDVARVKATITQLFDLNRFLADAESDRCFCFFWSKNLEMGKGGCQLHLTLVWEG